MMLTADMMPTPATMRAAAIGEKDAQAIERTSRVAAPRRTRRLRLLDP